MVTADKSSDSEDNHLLVREQLDAFTVNPEGHRTENCHSDA